jgi:phosphohistidine phosphatase
MKSVTFIRHAKSSWENNLLDRDRPLKEIGVKDAMLVANYFKGLSINHDLIVSSPANRALSTYDIFNYVMDMKSISLNVIESLYDFEGHAVKTELTKLNNSFSSVMLFGHNFALTKMANQLSNTTIDHVPTSGLFRLEFNIDLWSQLKIGQLTHFITPKQLK